MTALGLARATGSRNDGAVTRRLRALAAAGLALLVLSSAPAGAAPSQPIRAGRETGFAIPRFVSVRASQANVRHGPGLDYSVKWRFVRKGVPVEILVEFENWRKLRDWEGQVGWIHEALLSGRRTALVAPWSTSLIPMREGPSPEAPLVARAEPMVLVDLAACNGTWCSSRVDGREGYIRQDRLWGVYPGERFGDGWSFSIW